MKTKQGKSRGRIFWTPREQWFLRSVLGLVGVLALGAGWAAVQEEQERAVVPAGSDIRLPLRNLKAGKLHLVKYSTDGSTTVPVAVERGDDKVVRVALGLCRNCWRPTPYTLSGKLMCGRCRHVMKLPDPKIGVEEKQGGCALTGVPYSVAGDELVVRRENVIAAVAGEFAPSTKAGVNR
jgi:uncharacterized membrane protein